MNMESRYFAEAECLIAEGWEQIRRLERIIAASDRTGLDAKLARDLLIKFLNLQELHERRLKRLRDDCIVRKVV